MTSLPTIHLVLEGMDIRHLLRSLGNITSDWTQGESPQPWKMKIPDVLGDAWLHLIISLVQRVDHHYHKAYKELKGLPPSSVQAA